MSQTSTKLHKNFRKQLLTERSDPFPKIKTSLLHDYVLDPDSLSAADKTTIEAELEKNLELRDRLQSLKAQEAYLIGQETTLSDV